LRVKDLIVFPSLNRIANLLAHIIVYYPEMSPLYIALLFFYVASIKAAPTLPVREGTSESNYVPPTSNQTQTGWSRQDIFTLASVGVAMVGILIGAFLASPTLREWLCKPFHSKLKTTFSHDSLYSS
jgi:hypothetical protein